VRGRIVVVAAVRESGSEVLGDWAEDEELDERFCRGDEGRLGDEWGGRAAEGVV